MKFRYEDDSCIKMCLLNARLASNANKLGMFVISNEGVRLARCARAHAFSSRT